MKDEKKIVKKIFKKAAHGHHGGAWKIAYADFVTAMMAFFLLMWLINSISVEQKKGIADYFTPNTSKLKSKPSGEGALAGKNMDGQALTDMTGSVTDEENNTENQKKFNSNSDKLNNDDNTGGKRSDFGESKEMDKAEEPEEEKQKIKALIETQEQIKKALEASVALKTLANQVIFEMKPEGMNINIVDKDNRSMFPPGNYEMYDYMRNLLSEIAGTIREKPNKIGISGHTGSAQFSDTKNYSNWELSADRANASRRVLESAGIDPEKIEYVKGREGRDPLKKENPDAPENRRITLTLLK